MISPLDHQLCFDRQDALGDSQESEENSDFPIDAVRQVPYNMLHPQRAVTQSHFISPWSLRGEVARATPQAEGGCAHLSPFFCPWKAKLCNENAETCGPPPGMGEA